MDYFSKFLRPTEQNPPKVPLDHAQELHKSWNLIRNTLMHPDERQLAKGINSTDVPAHLKSMVDLLVWESTRTEEGETGACLEYLLKNDILGHLVRLSEHDRPSGIQAEVLRTVQNMVVLLDEQFLVHSAVHRAVLRLLRNCVGDDIQEQLDGKKRKVMGAAGTAVRAPPSEHEEDLVNLLCILCSRIRTHRELLMIFFHDKHWYRSEPLFAVEEENNPDLDESEDEDEDEEEEDEGISEGDVTKNKNLDRARSPSPSHSQVTVISAPVSSQARKPEYEFLLFNYLLRFVHREGQIGEFARAGLLFLMDVAMSPGEPISRIADDLAEKTPSDPVTEAALALAEYIVDGDFSEVLGAGLSAVYSLLPSKLEYRPQTTLHAVSGSAMVIGGTSVEERDRQEADLERRRALGVEDASSPDFQSRLGHFLKLLEFIQDVLRRNVIHDTGHDPNAFVGTTIVQSILDAVRRIFLENVLYPSILECSDSDGSAVAVMSYIEVMVRTLEEGALSSLLVDFLTSEDNDALPRSRTRKQSTVVLGEVPPLSKGKLALPNEKQDKLRRRKSSAMVLLEMEAPESNKQTEYFTSMGRFTLRDLLMSNLRSSSQSTATSALQLLQSMLIQHSWETVDRLLVVIPDRNATSSPTPALCSPLNRARPSIQVDGDGEENDEDIAFPVAEETGTFDYDVSVFIQPQTTYFTHEREMGLYLTLVSRVDPSHNEDAFSTGYDHYLRDALFAIQDQRSFQLDDNPESRSKLKHRLNLNDPIITLILDSLRRFFFNTPEFNLSLTGVLATLAINPDRSLAGWLTFGSNDAAQSQNSGADVLTFDDDGDDRSIDFRIEENLAHDSNPLPASSMDEQSRPVVHSIFHAQVAQLERYRQMVDDFDKYFLERRQGLLFNENLTDALTLALDIGEDVGSPRGSTSNHKISVSSPTQKQLPKSKPTPASFFTNLLTPKKTKSATAINKTPHEPPMPIKPSNDTVEASPFGSHYQRTSAIVVEPFIAPVPVGSWTPLELAKCNADEDVLSSASQWAGNGRRNAHKSNIINNSEKPSTVTLSRLLDNVVILEESIKELVAIIQARRSLGIDSVRYL